MFHKEARPTQFSTVRRASVIAIVWYALWITVSVESSLNLPLGKTMLYVLWLFASVSCCMVLSLQKDMHRYVAMIIGFLVGVSCFYEGIVYLYWVGGVGPAIFLAFLVGTQGAVAGAIVLAIILSSKKQLQKIGIRKTGETEKANRVS